MESKRIELENRTTWLNKKGNIHRLGGPAIEWKWGTKEWFINGKRHREDGPAYTYGNDKSWFLNGIQYTEEEWKEEIVKLKLNRIKDL